MSLDRIWMCPSLKREDWVDVALKSRALILDDEILPETPIDQEFQKYESFKVLISAGENFLFDEEYCFLSEDDARRFFAGGPLGPGEQGYRDQERFEEGAGPAGSDRGIGFDRVELYIRGELVARK
jgi:hypothetical protein